MMCIFGEFIIGEVGGLAGEAIAQRALRSTKIRIFVKDLVEGESGAKQPNLFNVPKKGAKARNTPAGEKVRAPDTHRDDFVKNKQGQRTNKHTGEIWENSHKNHSRSEDGEWKVGTRKGKSSTKNNKVTVASDGTVIKVDK